MKIYTYYEDINFNFQDKMIDLWKKSWEQHGFEAVVLTLEDAKKNPYYEEFVTNLKYLNTEIAGKDIGPYELSCHVRWLAYSIQEDTDAFFVSDYDVINKNFNSSDINEPLDKILFLDGYCPCFVYGTAQQYLKFCKDIIECSHKHKESSKQQYAINKSIYYHDQEFLSINHEKLDYNFCPSGKYVRFYEHGNEQMKDFNLFHIAHRSAKEAKLNFPELQSIHSEQLRIDFIREILNL